jgi:hypothetical protein
MIMHYLHTLGPLGQGVIKKKLMTECNLPPRKADSVIRVFNKWKSEMEDGRLSAFDLSTKARMALSHRGIDSVTDLQMKNMMESGWEKKLPKEVRAEINRLDINLGIKQ